MSTEKKVSEVEIIKEKSNYLRGTLKESLLEDTTGALIGDDTSLIKFHGTYQQTDRDLDAERKKQKLEPLYSFMIRVRVPGGIASPSQYLNIDRLSAEYGNDTIKITTRQTFQLHGVLKRNLKATMKKINNYLMTSIAACGDVNRNVMCNPNPYESPLHQQVYEMAKLMDIHFTPQTKAYYEVWLNDELQFSTPAEDKEPIYGKTYLPRKFKIAFAIPPYNDTDIFSNDLAFVAIEDKGKLAGFNVYAGGGMGMTFGVAETYPRIASSFGFTPTDKALAVAEEILKIQRDYGNRENRKLSRLKYTIDRMGVAEFGKELHSRLGWELQPERPYKFSQMGDRYGWHQGSNGRWSITLFIEGGRIRDTEKVKLKTALRETVQLLDGDVRLTPNQNIILANISPTDKPLVDSILRKYNVYHTESTSGLRLNSLACASLPLCPLAFAEAERYLPSLIDKIELTLREMKLQNEEISIRMTGCPNGCARPYLGEIGLVGRAPGKYNLYLGASFTGTRLNKLYKEMLDEQGILEELQKIFS
ncbi:MAG TPA: NADPH-dependent assimilatory sulfite reductase hemoprotein subunit, partial [Bacteroidales bacterium]|nr:NADPH-dependent assimilatory sulfite reductase hemoprotein subunit [Bacteroidales bacterium]